MESKHAVLILVGGITLLAGLIPSTLLLVGATPYGLPFPWLFRLVIPPPYSPWRIDVGSFVIDVVVWTLVIGFVFLVLRRKGRNVFRKKHLN